MFYVLLYKYIYMYKSIFYFETKPRQLYPTVYPSNSTLPKKQKQKQKQQTKTTPNKTNKKQNKNKNRKTKQNQNSIISFADRKSGQMRRPKLDLVVGIAKGISTLAN